ncbi:MAG: CHASE2 domain-containing protein, partial [Candidatus Omnitrophica bacterium]|nr:CHASE2 domain-containing protein [Candidatus Omnitrophota bacterium]
MKKNAVDWKLAVFCAAAFAAAYFFIPERIFLSVNDLPNQYHYNASGRTVAVPARIVAVAIDDYSHSRMTQRWPWTRSVYADLFRNLDREGVRTIALDVFLRGSSGDPLDAGYLSRALQEIKASVVLGYEFDFQNMAPGAIVEEIP